MSIKQIKNVFDTVENSQVFFVKFKDLQQRLVTFIHFCCQQLSGGALETMHIHINQDENVEPA